MRINVISLVRRPERLAEFHKLNKHLTNVTVFNAIDGLSLAPNDLAARRLIEPPVRYTAGALGNMMSHTTLWDHAAATGEITTVCEDDAIFNYEFQHLALGLISSLPDDANVIYWGWNFDAQTVIELIPGMSPCATGFGKNPHPSEIAAFQNCRITPTAYRLLRAFGTLCYTITPNGARRLRALCLPVRNDVWDFPEIKLRVPNVAIDVAICNAMPRVRAFCSFPPLAMSLNDRNQSNVQPRPCP